MRTIVNFRTTTRFAGALKDCAARHGATVSSLVREAVADRLAADGALPFTSEDDANRSTSPASLSPWDAAL